MNTTRHALILAATALFAVPALAQTPAPPAPATNSGVLRRVPLDEWMPPSCPNPEQRGEIIVCGRPEEEPTVPSEAPVPGDRGTDVQSERAALLAPENAAPSTSCTPVGGAGEYGCNRAAIEQWRREQKLKKAREKAASDE